MQDLLNFIQYLLPTICDFLLTAPISYFVGIFVFLGVIGLVKKIIF